MQLPDIGEVVAGRYQVQREIGRGGFSAVFAATQLAMDRLVALKVLLPQSAAVETVCERFRREAHLAKKLSHPNTIQLFDFGVSEGGCPFIAMEYLEGETLETVLVRDGALGAVRAVRIAVQVLKSLSEAHGHGVVHRDLKPANIFLRDLDGERDFVKVLDFGIAKVVSESALTQQGVAFGTPSYMAPEQIRGLELGPAADLYSLSLIILKMLTGRTAVDGGTPIETAALHLLPDPVAIPAWVEGCALGPIIRRGLEKEAHKRYGRALEMLDALQSASLTSLVVAAGDDDDDARSERRPPALQEDDDHFFKSERPYRRPLSGGFAAAAEAVEVVASRADSSGDDASFGVRLCAGSGQGVVDQIVAIAGQLLVPIEMPCEVAADGSAWLARGLSRRSAQSLRRQLTGYGLQVEMVAGVVQTQPLRGARAVGGRDAAAADVPSQPQPVSGGDPRLDWFGSGSADAAAPPSQSEVSAAPAATRAGSAEGKGVPLPASGRDLPVVAATPALGVGSEPPPLRASSGSVRRVQAPRPLDQDDVHPWLRLALIAGGTVVAMLLLLWLVRSWMGSGVPEPAARVNDGSASREAPRDEAAPEDDDEWFDDEDDEEGLGPAAEGAPVIFGAGGDSAAAQELYSEALIKCLRDEHLECQTLMEAVTLLDPSFQDAYSWALRARTALDGPAEDAGEGPEAVGEEDGDAVEQRGAEADGEASLQEGGAAPESRVAGSAEEGIGVEGIE